MDPIVAEIHAIREALAKQYNDDLAAYSAAAEARCVNLGLKFVEAPRSAGRSKAASVN